MIIIPTPASLPISTANAPTEAINQQNQQQQRVAASQGSDGSNNLQNNLKKPKEELDEARIRLDEERRKRKKKQYQISKDSSTNENEDEDNTREEARKKSQQAKPLNSQAEGESPTSDEQTLETPAALAAYRFKSWASHQSHKSLPLALDNDGKPNLTAAMKLLRNYLRNSS